MNVPPLSKNHAKSTDLSKAFAQSIWENVPDLPLLLSFYPFLGWYEVKLGMPTLLAD